MRIIVFVFLYDNKIYKYQGGKDVLSEHNDLSKQNRHISLRRDSSPYPVNLKAISLAEGNEIHILIEARFFLHTPQPAHNSFRSRIMRFANNSANLFNKIKWN